MFNEAFPILSTSDLPRALAFYRDLLDAKAAYQFPPEGDPVYIGLEIGSSPLGLSVDDSEAGGNRQFSLWIYADDCDAAIERLRAGGVRIVAEPEEQPWGERVATVQDPDGNSVIIGQKPST